MTVDGSLKFDTQIDTGGFNKGTNTIKTQANGLKRTFVSLGKVIAGAFILKKSIDIGKQALDLASDLQEVQNVVDVAFGEMAYKIEQFADKSIESFGLSELAAKSMASTYMAMYRGMGQLTDQASDMAVEITGRLGDIMSFFNKTQTEVDTIGKAIATGETEPLKAIGVVATETNLALFAMQKGFKKVYSEMEASEKLLIRQMYFLDRTSMAAGDFARTSDSWANQTRVLGERWKEFLGILGQGLIQVLTPTIKFLNTGMSYMISMAKTTSEILSAVFGFESEVVEGTSQIQTGAVDAADGYNELGEATKKAGEEASKAAAPFDKLNQTVGELGAGSETQIDMPSINIKTGEAAEQTKKQIEKSFEDLREDIEPTLDSLEDLKDALKPLAGFAFDNVENFYSDTLKPIGKWVLGEGLPRFLDIISGLLTAVSWEELTKALKSLYKAITPFAVSVGEGLLNFLEVMADMLEPVLATTAELLAEAINAIASAIDDMPEDAAIAVGGAIGGIVTAILLFNGATAIKGIILGLKGSLQGLLAALAAHPMLAIAVGIGAVAGAILALDKAKFENSTTGKLIQAMNDLDEAAEDHNKNVKEMLELYDEREKDIEAEYGAISILADKYFELADQEKLTAEQQALLKTYAGELIQKVPELSGLIDEQTGAYKGTKEEIQNLIAKTKEYYLVQAAQEKLIEIAKLQYENEKILKERQEERSEVLKELSRLTELYNEAEKEAGTITASSTQEQKNAALKAMEYEGIIFKLNKELKEFDKKTQETIDSQQKINDEWDFATEYIANYSTQVDKDMEKVKKSVDGALTAIQEKVRDIDLPKLMIDIGFNTPDSLGNLRAVYDYPGYATGNVIPANYGNFLAVLGDNKREPEVVSPVSKIEEAVENVLNRRGGAGGGAYTFIAQLNGKTIYEETVRQDQMQKKSSGNSKLGN